MSTPQVSHSSIQSSELPAIHNFFLSRHHADAFWDKTLMLSTETAYKVAGDYVEVYGDFYDAVVQTDGRSMGVLKASFLKLARDLDLPSADGSDISSFDPSVVSQVYEHLAENPFGKVVIVFWCRRDGKAYSDISFIVDYVPMRCILNSRCPFTLITIMNFHSPES